MNNWQTILNSFNINVQDVYFSNNYLKLFSENNEGKQDCFVFSINEKRAIYPFLINSVNKLGYSLDDEYYDIQGVYGYNGVLSNSMDSHFIDEFYKSFEDYCKQNNIIAEFTRFHPILENQEFSNNYLQIIYDRETVALDLTKNYESIWLNEYSSRNRNMIRKARKAGYTMEVIESPTSLQINTFVDIYTYSMKVAEAEEYYFFNKAFFYNTFSFLKNHALLFNVLDSKKNVICTSIFLHYGDFFHYHLSGRSKEADNAVNNFILDEAVKYAQNIGAKMFHFGGGRSTNPDDSLLKFKSNFSKTLLHFYVGKKIHNKKVYDEVVRQWEINYPEKISKYKNHLLKYRY